MKRLTRWLSLAVCLLFITNQSVSARTFRDVFLVDVSASMSGQGDKSSASVFEHMRTELRDAFATAKDTHVDILTFGTNVFTTNRFELPQELPSMDEFLQGLTPRTGRTDIYAAWAAGVPLLQDSTSRLFLISDGQHNSKVNSLDKLEEQITAWKSTHPHGEAYLVLLDPSYDGERIVSLFDEAEGMHVIRTLKGIYDEPEVAPAPKPQPAPTPAPEVKERPEWVIWLATSLFIAGLVSLLLFYLCIRRKVGLASLLLFLYNRRREA